jgi:putative membrane protein
MIVISDLATLNAGLNATAAVLIGAGFYFIKRKNIKAHKTCMIAAMIVSAVFLTSYLIYHYNVYFPLLLTHTVLAAVVLPMVLRTAFLALKGRFRNHVGIARWTFPIWMYVSVTGVIVYVMLYH